jgi:diaminopimelate decarboxylase
MHHFQYRNQVLHCEDLSLRDLAETWDTPLYIYSYATLKRHLETFDRSFGDLPHLTCFSVKANSNLAIINLFSRWGAGTDIVSGGELFRALRAGVDPGKVVYSGVGKTPDEIAYALEADILMLNVESEQELSAINEQARKMGVRARIALRVNPEVDPKTHPYISTGMKKNKFGLDVDAALENYRTARKLPHLEVVGVDCHIGSQLTELAPFRDALQRIKTLTLRLKDQGFNIQYLDMGGGLGITYDQEEPPEPAEYAQVFMDELKSLDCTLILEPGRVITGNAGVLLTRVLYTKKSPAKNFLIVDAGMNDLIRPSLYGSFHRIVPVVKDDGRDQITVDVVGPICESGDFLARDRSMPVVQPGELLAVMSAGAYGFSMSSNYNSRCRAAEVLVKEDKAYLIRDREDYEDLVRGEVILEL